MSKRVFYIDEVRKLVNQLIAEEISMSKFTEILNEKATGMTALELWQSEQDSRCNKHGVTFDYINGKAVCPICEP